MRALSQGFFCRNEWLQAEPAPRGSYASPPSLAACRQAGRQAVREGSQQRSAQRSTRRLIEQQQPVHSPGATALLQHAAACPLHTHTLHAAPPTEPRLQVLSNAIQHAPAGLAPRGPRRRALLLLSLPGVGGRVELAIGRHPAGAGSQLVRRLSAGVLARHQGAVGRSVGRSAACLPPLGRRCLPAALCRCRRAMWCTVRSLPTRGKVLEPQGPAGREWASWRSGERVGAVPGVRQRCPQPC